MIDKQILIDDFIAKHPEYAKKKLEIDIYDGKYDIYMIMKNDKKEWIRTYKLKDKIELQGTDEDEIFKGLNNYFRKLAERQIRIAFEQAEKEVEDLHQRTREGIETARLNGKQIGQRPGIKLKIKKEVPAKEIILTHGKTFGGTLDDEQCRTLAKVSRNTYYKYKRELRGV